MRPFKWTKRKSEVAILLADGYTIRETSEITGVPTRTIDFWKSHIEYQTEIDRLSVMVGLANRAERLRLAKKIMRKLAQEKTPTQKDLLEWMKYAQSETDGIKLDIASLVDAAASVAGGGSAGDEPQDDSKK
jgi:DNA-binding CsgD family transcriptional regulator